MTMAAEEDEIEDTSFTARISRKINSIPCLREGLITGITGGFVVGFATFLFTSRPARAYKWGLISSVVLLNLDGFRCTYYRWLQEQTNKGLKVAMRQSLLIEGTAEAAKLENFENLSALSDTEGHVPEDELEAFERKAREKLAGPGPPADPSILPEDEFKDFERKAREKFALANRVQSGSGTTAAVAPASPVTLTVTAPASSSAPTCDC